MKTIKYYSWKKYLVTKYPKMYFNLSDNGHGSDFTWHHYWFNLRILKWPWVNWFNLCILKWPWVNSLFGHGLSQIGLEVSCSRKWLNYYQEVNKTKEKRELIKVRGWDISKTKFCYDSIGACYNNLGERSLTNVLQVCLWNCRFIKYETRKVWSLPITFCNKIFDKNFWCFLSDLRMQLL